jgi:hypothetical protein
MVTGDGDTGGAPDSALRMMTVKVFLRSEDGKIRNGRKAKVKAVLNFKQQTAEICKKIVIVSAEK